MGVLAKQIQDLKGIDIWGFCEVLDESWAKIFRQSANKSSESRRGKFRESGIPLILMGDWCGELSIADTNARNPGKGEAEASVGAVLE